MGGWTPPAVTMLPREPMAFKTDRLKGSAAAVAHRAACKSNWRSLALRLVGEHTPFIYSGAPQRVRAAFGRLGSHRDATYVSRKLAHSDFKNRGLKASAAAEVHRWPRVQHRETRGPLGSFGSAVTLECQTRGAHSSYLR